MLRQKTELMTYCRFFILHFRKSDSTWTELNSTNITKPEYNFTGLIATFAEVTFRVRTEQGELKSDWVETSPFLARSQSMFILFHFYLSGKWDFLFMKETKGCVMGINFFFKIYEPHVTNMVPRDTIVLVYLLIYSVYTPASQPKQAQAGLQEANCYKIR